MTDKIIAAAREAGFSAENGRIFANCESSPAHVLCTNAASALYALAYRQGLEAQLKLPAEDRLPTLTPAGQQWADEQVAFAERLKKAEDRVKELEAQVQALSLDAGRYAYLSRQMGTLCITNADENTGPVFKAAAADSHIDAAIAAGKGEA